MRKVLSITLIILLGLSELSLGQTAEDAVKSLKKVEGRIQTGVSYQDFPQILADATKAVNVFLKSNEAKDNPQLAKYIDTTLSYYTHAKEIWDIKFNCKNDFVMEAVGINTNCGKEVKRLYPNSRPELLPGNLGPFYVVSNVLRSIFHDASNELKKVSKTLKSD
jgi:hypothetical protein